MAPNKFEKYIKEQLENREIRPSEEAWTKLSERLDEVSADRPMKKGYFRYAIAACFIGLIVLSVLFFKASAPNPQPVIQVVEEETDRNEEVETPSRAVEPNIPVEVVANEGTVVEKVATESKVKEAIIIKDVQTGPQWAESAEKVEIPLDTTSEEIIQTKLLEVLAQVDALEQEQEQITDAEVDSLLRKAQEELLTEGLFRDDHRVDAMALLSEVEYELDRSFRDQIFESLKSGFLKVRTAVADRNN